MRASYLWDKGWLKKVKDIYILKMFMPFPLKENNCFLVESDSGWVVIDTGVNLETNRTIFTDALNAIGISWTQISAIYLTHYHHDHIGLAGWLQQLSQAPVYLPAADLITWQTFIQTDTYLDEALPACLLAGWPADFAVELADDIKNINSMIKPFPVFTPFPLGELFKWAGQIYTPIVVPGHTDGHLVFYSPESKLLFSGDNVVAHVNLHLTDWPHNRITNPCAAHLSALRELGKISIDWVLPGHGNAFSNLNERIDDIISHHHNRQTQIFHDLKEPMTAWDLAENVFKPNSYIHIRRLALAETLAYLHSLVNENLVEYDLVNGSYVFQRSTG